MVRIRDSDRAGLLSRELCLSKSHFCVEMEWEMVESTQQEPGLLQMHIEA